MYLPGEPAVNDFSVNNYNTSATVNFDEFDGGYSTTYYVEYGTSTGNYSSTSTYAVSSNDLDEDNVDVVLTGLTTDIDYFYKGGAFNSQGSVSSSEGTFNTDLEPSQHPSTLSAYRILSDQVRLQFSSASSINAKGYIIYCIGKVQRLQMTLLMEQITQ